MSLALKTCTKNTGSMKAESERKSLPQGRAHLFGTQYEMAIVENVHTVTLYR